MIERLTTCSSIEEFRSLVTRFAEQWGRRDFMAEHLRGIDPGLARDPDFIDWYVPWHLYSVVDA